MGCTEIILKDPGADSGGKVKSKGAKKKKNDAKNYLSLRHLYLLFRLSLAPLPARDSPRIYGNLI